MGKPLVSVVIPIYQKEEYVEECIRSILNQTYREIELICIDDCSSDQSGVILKRLADEDSRIKIIINDRNRGAAVSRNIGLEIARGKYLSVLDADDFYDKELIEKSVLCCEKEQLDILWYDWCIYNDKSGEKIERSMPLTFRRMLKNKRMFSSGDIEEFSFQICNAGSWTKLYNREFIEQNNIRFQDIKSSNDVLFNKLAAVCAKRIGYIGCCWVNYRVGTEKQISNMRGEHSLYCAKSGAALKEELLARGLYKKNKRSFHTYIFKGVMNYISCIEEAKRAAYYQQIKDILEDIIDETEDAFLCSYYEHWYQDFMKLDGNENVDNRITNEYQYIFQYEKNKVEQLKKYIERKGFKTALWGYGKNGKAFFRQCGENNFPIDVIIDSNSEDSAVSAPEVLQYGQYIVLVASADLAGDIYKRARQLDGCMAVADIQSFFSYGVELEKCIFDSTVDREGSIAADNES